MASEHALKVEKNLVTWGTKTVVPETRVRSATRTLVLAGNSDEQPFSAYENMYIYSWKIYESDDGTSKGANNRLVRDYIPVKNGSGVPGLLDRVNGVFYPSATDTPLVAGGEIAPSSLSFLERLALDLRRVAADADPNATGGDIILKDGEDYIHIFSQVGSSTFTVNNACYATALLVGGGGGGGANDGGGGGAGGMVEVPSMDLSPYHGQSVVVTVGAGAAKVTDPGHGKNGSPSRFEGIATAYGGGGGGHWNDKAGNGGDGLGSGGGSCGGNATGTAGSPGASTTTYAEVKQGNDGGKGSEIGHGPAGGGGGAVQALADLVFDGALSVKVGAGGTKNDVRGGSSGIEGANFSYSVLGGGRGGNASKTSVADCAAQNGGSGGGGGAYWASASAYGNGAAGLGSGWGYAGSAGLGANPQGGGGGGAGQAATAQNSGARGACSDIIGQLTCFGGGGAGGHVGGNSHTVSSSGGLGGGGSSQTYHTTLNYAYPGVNGLGGGGCAMPVQYGGSGGDGKRGGDGIVIIRYTDTVQTPKIKKVTVPSVPSFLFNFQVQDTGIRDTEDYTVSGNIDGKFVGTYTLTLTLRDPDNMEWDDGSNAPKVIDWQIATETPCSSNFLYGLATNHNRIASNPLGLTGDLMLRIKETEGGSDYYRYVSIFTNETARNFSLATEISGAEVLLVGGGGAGGYGLGGGGGAGGYIYHSGVTLAGGSYTAKVGGGGRGNSVNGQDTVFSAGSMELYRAYGGGGGGDCGGAGAPGVNGETATWGAKGGDGLSNAILGWEQYYAGGGAGSAHECYNSYGSGGKGGGGTGCMRDQNQPRPYTTDTPKTLMRGENGLGGGGAAGSHSSSGMNQNGGWGGDGIVIVAYRVPAGETVAVPELSKRSFSYTGVEQNIVDELGLSAQDLEKVDIEGVTQATDCGTYEFTVKPKTGYHWMETDEFDPASTAPIAFSWTIVPRPLEGNVTIAAIAQQAYTGSAITPTLTVTDAELGRTLVKGADYTVEYFANVNIGTATIKLTGTGNYTTTANTTFQIVANPNEDSFYVTPEASDDGTGTGWDEPTSLKTAFALASALTDTTRPCAIYVKAGTYKNSSGPWTLSSGIKTMRVLGGYTGIWLARGTERTVLDGESARSLLSFGLQGGSDNYSRIVRFNQVDFVNAVEAVVGTSGKGDFEWCQLAFESCRFTGNKTSTAGHGAVLWINPSTIQIMPIFRQCEIRGNYATVAGAYILHGGQRGRDYIGTAFVGNSGVSAPLIWLQSWQDNPLTIRNCTFAYNAISETLPGDKALVVGGGSAGVSWTSVSNTICACNSDANGSSGHRVIDLNGAVTYDYVLLGEGDTCQERDGDRGCNTITNGDPLFAAGTLTPTFGGSDGVATWKNAAGETVNPVDMDVHLKSVMGRWNGSDWVNDSVTSPAIDAGDPASDFAAEPAPNGGRINLGAYGNTAAASKTLEVPEAEAATLSGATGFSEIKQLDNGHTVLIYSNVTDAASFTVAKGGIARILVVGGGGSGGFEAAANYRAGGGGAGGFVESNAVMLAAGTYTVVVGKGGNARSTKTQAGDNGGSSFVKLGDALVLNEALGGGGGGAGDTVAPQTGGSGGGRSYRGTNGADGTPGQGFAGGGVSREYSDAGGGGGGAGSVGSSHQDNVNQSTKGGDAKLSDITGELMAYAGGGAGCAKDCTTMPEGGSAGGIKVGGDAHRAGVNGTGSGGGGGDQTVSSTDTSGAGGSGIVVVHLYSSWTPRFEVTLDPNGGTGGKTSVMATYGEDMPELDEGDLPTRTGFDFAGYSRAGWEVKPMTGNDADFIDEGESKWAFTAYAGADQTVSGTTFVKSGLKETSPNEHGIVNGEPSFTTDLALKPFHSDIIAADFVGCTEAYKNVLVSRLEFQDVNKTKSSITFTLKRCLEPNRAYAVQITSYQNNTTQQSHRLGVSEGVYYGTGAPQNPKGVSFIYRFVATGTTQDVTLYKPLSDTFRISSVQLRELGDASALDKYYDAYGKSVKPWDIFGDATLYAQWEKSVVAVARPTQEWTSKPYTGADFKPMFAANDAYDIAYSANEWINVGDYTVTFTLKSGYEWETGDDKTSPVVLRYKLAAKGSYNAMRKDGPVISVDQQWLVTLAGRG